MAKISSLCVYCGSRDGADPVFRQTAEALGRGCAERGIRIVYGGGAVGLMGHVADAAIAAGGEVVGIIPDFLRTKEIGHEGVSELRVVSSMHERKQLMVDLSDAFCVLPGGLGTLDETFEILTWRQLRLHDKPVVFCDVGGFWAPLVELLRHQHAGGFIPDAHQDFYAFADTAEAVFARLADAPQPSADRNLRRA